METDIAKITEQEFQESITTLLQTLPEPVQDFLTGPESDRIALSLTQKYQLHTDQAGIFEKAYLFMLLGITNPEEFVTSLTKAGIPVEAVRGLAKDVNEQVFIPLRQAEQERGVAPATPASTPTAIAPQWVQVTPPAPTAPVTPPAPVQPIPQAVPAPVYSAPPAPLPSYAPPVPMPTAPLGSAPENLPIGHTMAADMEAARRQSESAASLGVPQQSIPVPPQQWGAAMPTTPQPWNIPPQGMQYAPPQLPPQAYMPAGYWPAQPMQAYPMPQPYPYAQPQAPPPPAAPPPPPVAEPAPAPIPEVRSVPPPPPVAVPPAPMSAADARAQAHDRFGLDPYREAI